MLINRRKAFTLLGAGAAGPAMAARKDNQAEAKAAFLHGAASGDPLADRVILWTCVTPASAGAARVPVRWQVATDETFAKVVSQGQASAGPDRDWTVKVEATGLTPNTDYVYRFEVLKGGKPAGPVVVGRTRTLPTSSVRDVVLAVTSCSLYPNGYFNAYDAIARLPRVDAVLHLGDYIYEYGAAPHSYGMDAPTAVERAPDPAHDLVSLADYRRRHAQYKTDLALQAAHARAPWIVVWDDHEVANDSWREGAQNHRPAEEGDWAARKAAALKAYYEWMPIREPATGGMLEQDWRAFQFGDVATLFMTETRLTARTEQLDYRHDLLGADGKPDIAGFKTKWSDPARRMMGEDQERWLAKAVAASTAAGTAWQVLGNQVVMARVAGPDLKGVMGAAAFGQMLAHLPEALRGPVMEATALSPLGLPYNLDSWDGYPADRERVYAIFKAAKAHPIVLAGDSHMFWANELHDASGALVAAEFGTTGITSPGYGDYLKGAPLSEAFVARNKEVRFHDAAAKGYVLLTLEKDRAVGELMAVSTIASTDYSVRMLKRFVVTPGADGGVRPLSED